MNEIQSIKTEKIEEVKKNSKKGFTLVELVVVIAILAILAAIAIPVVSSTIESSQRSSAASNAQSVELALKEAHAMIIANDTSAGYSSATKVTDVYTAKGLTNVPSSVLIAGTTYDLKLGSDEKVYYTDGTNSVNGTALPTGVTITSTDVTSSSPTLVTAVY